MSPKNGTPGPRRVNVERGIYRKPGTSGYEIVYQDSTGRQRWQKGGRWTP